MATTNMTTLKSTVANADLPQVGEIRFKITAMPSGTARRNTITITATGGAVTLKIIGSGNFTNNAFSTNAGTTATVAAGTTSTLYLSNGTYTLSIMNKYYITSLILGPTDGTNDYSNWEASIQQFRGMVSLTTLQLDSANITGDCYKALKLNTALTSLDLYGTSVQGDTTALLAALTRLTAYKFPEYTPANDVTLTITVASGTNSVVVSAVEGTVEMEVSGELFFTDSGWTSNKGTTLTISAGQSKTVYISKNSGTWTIKHAQYISVFQFDGNFATSSFNINQMLGMVNLTKFSWYGADTAESRVLLTGDISCFKQCTKLNYLHIGLRTLITGSIAVFANCPELGYLALQGSWATGEIKPVWGDISVLANCPKLYTLGLHHTNISGNIMSLCGLKLTGFSVHHSYITRYLPTAADTNTDYATIFKNLAVSTSNYYVNDTPRTA